MIGLTGEKTELIVGERRFALTKRTLGTPMLALKLEELSKTILEQEFAYSAPAATSMRIIAPAD
jgi:hypothetical protein